MELKKNTYYISNIKLGVTTDISRNSIFASLILEGFKENVFFLRNSPSIRVEKANSRLSRLKGDSRRTHSGGTPGVPYYLIQLETAVGNS